MEVNKISYTKLDNRFFFNSVSAFICVHLRLIYDIFRYGIWEIQFNSFVENVNNGYMPVLNGILREK